MEFGMEVAFHLVDHVPDQPIVAKSVSATDGSGGGPEPDFFFFHSDDSALESLLDNRESSRSAAADAGAHRTATADSGHRHGAINWSGRRTLTTTQKLGSDRRRRPDDRSRIGLRRSDRPVADDRYIAPLPHPGRHHPGRVRSCLPSCNQIRRPGDLVSLPACERATVSTQAHLMVNTVGVHVEKFSDAEYVTTGLRLLLDVGNGAARQPKALTSAERRKCTKPSAPNYSLARVFVFPARPGGISITTKGVR